MRSKYQVSPNQAALWTVYELVDVQGRKLRHRSTPLALRIVRIAWTFVLQKIKHIHSRTVASPGRGYLVAGRIRRRQAGHITPRAWVPQCWQVTTGPVRVLPPLPLTARTILFSAAPLA